MHIDYTKPLFEHLGKPFIDDITAIVQHLNPDLPPPTIDVDTADGRNSIVTFLPISSRVRSVTLYFSDLIFKYNIDPSLLQEDIILKLSGYTRDDGDGCEPDTLAFNVYF
ncbi:MAG: hypothetical protein HRU29_11485 [Rhizobiales bacterium]|nr:hypothetical protein [Hyphomicrobiales bacterium]NRB15011.1 hypothetical protein [Hyphomicrobiales bacterium]